MKSTSPTDSELVARALETPRAFGAIIELYEQPLLRYVMRLSDVSREDAEDVLQETFLKVYQHLNDYDESLSLSSWLYRIAHNQVISEWRKRKARPHGHVTDVEDYVINTIAKDFETLNDIDAQLLKQRISGMLAQLDVKYREVLVLYFFEDKSYKEIADILRKPPGTIATLLNRAKKKFFYLYQTYVPRSER
jgi:RNA polymerase sigma-70 factor (ECF subfamily)